MRPTIVDWDWCMYAWPFIILLKNKIKLEGQIKLAVFHLKRNSNWNELAIKSED